MIYVVSDVHGCYEKYRELLRAISFGKNDILYVLGDVIDRGPDGFQILLDMAQRPNVINLMGNHEAMAIDALPYLSGSKLTSEDDGEKAVKLDSWLNDSMTAFPSPTSPCRILLLICWLSTMKPVRNWRLSPSGSRRPKIC